MYFALRRMQYPAEAAAVRYPLFHLRLHLRETVAGGGQFHYEVRAQRKEAFLLALWNGCEPGPENPSGVGRSHGAVGQQAPRARIARDPSPVALAPHLQS